MTTLKPFAPMLMFTLLISACATAPHEPSNTSIISLDKPVHFLAADGGDVVVPPGIYQVAAVESRIWLIPSEGEQAPLLEAQAMTHDEPVTAPVALSLPQGEDEHHLILLLPEGKGLDAAGTYSGMRSRATMIYTPRPTVITAAMLSLTQVTLTPSTTTGGTTVLGAVYTGTAVRADVEVFLSSSGAAVAQTPASVHISSGRSVATFSIITKPVQFNTTVVITASAGGVSRGASLTVTIPPAAGTGENTGSYALQSVWVGEVVGKGEPSTGTVLLAGKVGLRKQVFLKSTDPTLVQVPSSVWVEAGQDRAMFAVTGPTPVAMPTAVTLSVSGFGINAVSELLGQVKTLTARVVPPTIKELKCLPPGVRAGDPVRCSITLTGPVASGSLIDGDLASSHPTVAPVPFSKFSLGSLEFKKDFDVRTLVTNPPSPAPVSVSISAIHAGITKSTTLTVSLPIALGRLECFAPQPRYLFAQCNLLTLGSSSVAVPVQLASSLPSVLAVPPNYLFPANTSGNTFYLGNISMLANATASVTISASYAGVVKSATVTFQGPQPPQ